MSQHNRYADGASRVAAGWRLEHFAGPSALYGANGMQFGPDGRLYVAQALGSQVSAIDVDGGAIEAVSPVGGAIIAPDDLAFDSRGDFYATEIMEARVSARSADGTTRVIADGLTAVNGITVHRDRIFADEFRPGGRLFELFPDGRAPRLLAADLPLPNALSVGPDGMLYFPAVVDGEIWRLPLEGGRPERFTSGLAGPTAVKFDARGFLVTPQALTGEVLRIDLQSGARSTVARVRRGIDNLAMARDGRLFLSHYTDGGVLEIVAGGAERRLVDPGFVGPMGLAFGPDGTLYAADGLSIAAVKPSGECDRVTMLLEGDYPGGFVRSVACGPDGTLYAVNSGGVLTVYRKGAPNRVLASDLEEVYGVAVAPGGSLLVAEGRGGRVVEIRSDGERIVRASGIGRPRGIAIAADGSCYVSDAGGRVLHVGDRAETVIDGLGEPQGVALVGGRVAVVDVGRKELSIADLDGGRRQLIASRLPVGAPSGIKVPTLMGIAGLLDGPLTSFADLQAGADGALYLSADGEGSILRLVPTGA